LIEAMTVFCLYISNVILIAAPLAIFEIWLEKYKSGWGGEFYNPFWGKKVSLGFILKVAEKTYVTVYHFVVWGLAVPILLILEFFILWHMSQSGFYVLDVASVRIVPSLFLLSVYLGVMVTEDFLWFALNWRFPGALRRLFRGDMKWHTKWVSLTRYTQLPRFYLTTPLLVLVLLVVQHILAYVCKPT